MKRKETDNITGILISAVGEKKGPFLSGISADIPAQKVPQAKSPLQSMKEPLQFFYPWGHPQRMLQIFCCPP